MRSLWQRGQRCLSFFWSQPHPIFQWVGWLSRQRLVGLAILESKQSKPGKLIVTFYWYHAKSPFGYFTTCSKHLKQIIASPWICDYGLRLWWLINLKASLLLFYHLWSIDFPPMRASMQPSAEGVMNEAGQSKGFSSHDIHTDPYRYLHTSAASLTETGTLDLVETRDLSWGVQWSVNYHTYDQGGRINHGSCPCWPIYFNHGSNINILQHSSTCDYFFLVLENFNVYQHPPFGVPI